MGRGEHRLEPRRSLFALFPATDMTASFSALRPLLEAQTPTGRFGETDDIAWAAVYLASEQAKFMTGQVLSPNGGFVMSQ